MIDASTLTWDEINPRQTPAPGQVPATGAGDWSTANPYTGADISGNITQPEGWNLASSYWKNMLQTGGGGGGGWGEYQSPYGDIKTRLGTLTATGEPVDISGWWAAQKPIYAQQYEDQAKQMAEQMGLGGRRWSSPLQRNIAEMIQRGQTSLTGTAMEQQLSADEAARQRVLQALGMSTQIAQSEEAQRQAYAQAAAAAGYHQQAMQSQAAQNLFGWGSAENQLAMNLANQLSGLGAGQFGMEQAQYGNIYNQPWMQQGMGMLGQAGGGYPAMYQPSIWENLAGASSYLPQIVSMFGGAGGGLSAGGDATAGTGALGYG